MHPCRPRLQVCDLQAALADRGVECAGLKKRALYDLLVDQMVADFPDGELSWVVVMIASAVGDKKLLHGDTHALGVQMLEGKPVIISTEVGGVEVRKFNYIKLYLEDITQDKVLGTYRIKNDVNMNLPPNDFTFAKVYRVAC